MTPPCWIGLMCPYRWCNGSECGAPWHLRYPQECPIVRKGSPLERKLDEEAGE